MVLEMEATHAQIQRILQSKAFRTSEVHRSLLIYLAEKSLEGTADGLKEYTVGLDVFAKPASFDPRQESAVRMHVARLRQKLAEYYRTEGAGDAVIVDLPKGGFKMTFEPRPVSIVREPTLRPTHRSVLLLAVALALAIFRGFVFGISTLARRAGARSRRDSMDARTAAALGTASLVQPSAHALSNYLERIRIHECRHC